MWDLARIWIDSDNDIEEEVASQEKVHIHKEMARMRLHQITKEIGEVENKE